MAVRAAIIAALAAACSAEGAAQSTGPDGAPVLRSPLRSQCEARLAPTTGTVTRSFEGDVMPIFGLSCNFGPCHGGTSTSGHLLLGPQCTLDAASGACEFEADALSGSTLDEVYAALISRSLRGGELARVTPSKPSESFLLLKLSNCHDVLGPEIGCGTDCGREMPPALDFYENSPGRYRILAEWVTQGAPR